MNQIFQEYTESTPAKITLTTPADKKVEFTYRDKCGPGGYGKRYMGLFVADFEVGYCLTTIAHVHYVNDPTRLTGYFDMEITFGCGEEATTERISGLTLEQVCKIIDLDDWEFCLDLCTNRGVYNKFYWPEEKTTNI
jgi:hypothetical protein